jgi:capsid protein
MLALVVKKTEQGPGSNFGRRAGTPGVAVDPRPTTGSRSTSRRCIPGIVADHLAPGEEPVPFSNQGTDVDFGKFEEAVVQAMAWCHGVPPEILTLSFTNNYSASQAAINEFKIYLNLVRTEFGEQFCQYVYVEWLLASALAGKVKAPGLLEAFRDYSQHDVWGAWVSADWAGHIKPAVDLSKLVTGYGAMVEQGFMTRARATRELTGMKHSKERAAARSARTSSWPRRSSRSWARCFRQRRRPQRTRASRRTRPRKSRRRNKTTRRAMTSPRQKKGRTRWHGS